MKIYIITEIHSTKDYNPISTPYNWYYTDKNNAIKEMNAIYDRIKRGRNWAPVHPEREYIYKSCRFDENQNPVSIYVERLDNNELSRYIAYHLTERNTED